MGILGYLYYTGCYLKKRYALRTQKRLSAKVISIGNLTLGGTGKTPAVIAVAQEAEKRGFLPCILTRGYKGKTKGECFVSKGEGPLLNAHQTGDEPHLMAERLDGIPIVMGKNRYKSGILAMQTLSSQTPNSQTLFILDDGFQRWALHRDIDILLIDATNPFGNERLFPEGILREPLNAMRRADIIVITKADMAGEISISGIIQKVKRYNPEAPIYRASHKPIALANPSGEAKPLETLNNREVYAFAGIANPSYFKALLGSEGADIVKFRTFRDHYIYKQRDINKIKKDAAGLEIITTEKDMVKLKGLEIPENIFALRIEFSVVDTFYNHILEIKV